MNRDEVTELLNYINLNYPQYEVDGTIIDAWLNELQVYDLEDVKKNLKQLMSEDLYSKTPPLLSRIIRGLTPKSEKLDFTKSVIYCPRCHKGFNSHEEEDEHFGKCSSVDYVIKETRKWFKKELTRKELFAMSDEEFQERYKKLLWWIHDHTKDEREKARIEFIFNPPSREKAKAFIAGGM